MKHVLPVFKTNFSHVGVTPDGPPYLYEESPFTYQFWGSGRKNMHYCKVEVSVHFFSKFVLIFIAKKTTRPHLPAFLEHRHASQGQANHRNAFHHEECPPDGFCDSTKERRPKIPLKL